jgi:hypothetical protein
MPHDLSDMDPGYTMLLSCWTNPLALSNEENKRQSVRRKDYLDKRLTDHGV